MLLDHIPAEVMVLGFFVNDEFREFITLKNLLDYSELEEFYRGKE